MIPTKEINFQDVEGLTRRLLRRKITRSRFSIELPTSELANYIQSGMRAQVISRGGEVEFSEKFLGYIHQAAEWLRDPNQKPGLLLKGLWGNGKTTMTRAIATIIADVTEATFGYGKRQEVIELKAKDVVTELLSDKGLEKFEKLKKIPMLAIDDLGKEATEVIKYGQIFEPLMDILDYRYDRQLFTMITTNLTSQEIEDRYTMRIRDRFREMVYPIHFTNPSFRK